MTDSISGEPPEEGISPALIQAARDGSEPALQQLFELARPYLLDVAENCLPNDLKSKGSSSDIVQESCLDAHKSFAGFQGTTEEELKAWLRQILLHNQLTFIQRWGTIKRQAEREEPLPAITDAWEGPEVSSVSPSGKAVHREDVELLRQALARLPEDQRQVIEWRGQDRLTFKEIGRRLNASAEAVRKVWARGIEKLREEMGGSHEGP